MRSSPVWASSEDRSASRCAAADGTLRFSIRIAISIPALIFYRHYRNKVDTYVVEMEQQASKLVDLVHGERVDFPGQPR